MLLSVSPEKKEGRALDTEKKYGRSTGFLFFNFE